MPCLFLLVALLQGSGRPNPWNPVGFAGSFVASGNPRPSLVKPGRINLGSFSLGSRRDQADQAISIQ